jgi:hypothetical protein
LIQEGTIWIRVSLGIAWVNAAARSLGLIHILVVRTIWLVDR